MINTNFDKTQIWSGHGNSLTDSVACFFKILEVDYTHRVCTILTYGSNNKVSDGRYVGVQWLTLFGGINGEEIGYAPDVGNLGVCIFLNGVPWIIGFFNAITESVETPVDNPEDEAIKPERGSAGFNKQAILAGDISLRTKSGCRVALHRSGIIEIEATKVCRTVHSPMQNKMTSLCQNYQMQNDGGSIEWGHTSDYSEAVKYMQSYRDTIRSAHLVTEEYGMVEPDSTLIWRVTIGKPKSKNPAYRKDIHNTGASQTVVNKKAVQKFVEADGTTILGIGGYNYYHEIKPSGSMVLCVGTSFSMAVSSVGMSMDFGPGSAIKAPGMPPMVGQGKFSMTILPTGSFNINVGGVGDLTIDTLGGVALSTAARGTIVIDPLGGITLTAARDVTVIAPMTNIKSAMIGLGVAPADNVPLGNLILASLNQFIADYKVHIHGNGNQGSPTTPPTNSTARAIPAPAVLSKTVRVQL